MACASFPIAICPSGITTTHWSPARAAYAAAEADVLPVEAQSTTFAPRAFARETATVIPRSLNDPVGFCPSILMKSWMSFPSRPASAGAGTSGVPPSRSVTTDSSGISGRISLNSRTTPRHGLSPPLARVPRSAALIGPLPSYVEDPHGSGRLADGPELGDSLHRLAHVAIHRLVRQDRDRG